MHDAKPLGHANPLLHVLYFLAGLGIVGFLMGPALPMLLPNHGTLTSAVQSDWPRLTQLLRYGHLGVFLVCMLVGYAVMSWADRVKNLNRLPPWTRKLAACFGLSIIFALPANRWWIRPPGLSVEQGLLNFLALPTVPWTTPSVTSLVEPVSAAVWFVSLVIRFYFLVFLWNRLLGTPHKWLALTFCWPLVSVILRTFHAPPLVLWLIGADTAPFFALGMVICSLVRADSRVVSSLLLLMNTCLAVAILPIVIGPWVEAVNLRLCSLLLVACIVVVWAAAVVRFRHTSISRWSSVLATGTTAMLLLADPLGPALMLCAERWDLRPLQILVGAFCGCVLLGMVTGWTVIRVSDRMVTKLGGYSSSQRTAVGTGNCHVERNRESPAESEGSSTGVAGPPRGDGSNKSSRLGMPAIASRLEAIDALRLIAAVGVVFGHYISGHSDDGEVRHQYWLVHPADLWPALHAWTKYGYLGVYLFFVISGFVILMTASSGSIPKFIASRVGRLFPAYWVSLIAVIPVALLYFPLNRYNHQDVILSFSMMQGSMNIFEINPPYWTLWAELRFYLTMIAFMMIGITRRRVLWFATLWPIIGFAARVFKSPSLETLLMSEYSPYFAGGMVLYVIYQHGTRVRYVAVLGMNVILALNFNRYLLAIRAEGAHPMNDSLVITYVLVVLCFGLVWLCSSRPFHHVRSRWLVFGGALSYPLYVLHEPMRGAVLVLTRNLHIEPGTMILCCVVASIAASWVVYRYVEKPFGPRLRRAILQELLPASPAEASQTGARLSRSGSDLVDLRSSVSTLPR